MAIGIMEVAQLRFPILADVFGMQTNRGIQVPRKATANVENGFDGRSIHTGNENRFHTFGLLLRDESIQLVRILRVIYMGVSINHSFFVRIELSP